MIGTAEPVEAHAAKWLLRLEAEDCTDKERQDFEAWAAADSSRRAAFEAAVELWRELDAVSHEVAARSSAFSAGTNAHIRRGIRSRMGFPRRWQPSSSYGKRRGRFVWRATAAIIVLVMAGLLFREPLILHLQADATTRVGESKSLTLEDGSRIQLNTDSAVAVHYTPEAREVVLLKGEAAFEVIHDTRRPFRVHALSGVTTAVGTIFEVALSSQDVHVTVTEGRVRVQSGVDSAEIGAGLQISYTSPDHLGVAAPVDVEAVSAWRRGRISFINEPLGEVVRELDRYHRGLIVLSDDALARRPVSGDFETADPLAAVTAIEHSLGLHSRRFTDYLVILGK